MKVLHKTGERITKLGSGQRAAVVPFHHTLFRQQWQCQELVIHLRHCRVLVDGREESRDLAGVLAHGLRVVEVAALRSTLVHQAHGVAQCCLEVAHKRYWVQPTDVLFDEAEHCHVCLFRPLGHKHEYGRYALKLNIQNLSMQNCVLKNIRLT